MVTSTPTHFLDKHKMAMKEETKTACAISNDIIRVIEKIAATAARETHVKCEHFEITVKK